MSMLNLVKFHTYLRNIFKQKNNPNVLLQRKVCLKFLDRGKSYDNPTGTPGAGAGKGGGAGGSIKESGGGLGQYGTAQEEQYFFNKSRDEIKKLKNKLKEGKGDTSSKEDK